MLEPRCGHSLLPYRALGPLRGAGDGVGRVAGIVGDAKAGSNPSVDAGDREIRESLSQRLRNRERGLFVRVGEENRYRFKATLFCRQPCVPPRIRMASDQPTSTRTFPDGEGPC